jgi:ankyrin repeat protein
MRIFISHLSHSKMFSLLIITLIALAWSIPAFCGEINGAAKAGDLAKVKALLKDNSKLALSRDYFGASPLHLAARWGNTDIAKLLLANYAEVNGNKSLVELLLANGADVNVRAIDNRIAWKWESIWENVRPTNYHGWTPLHAAVWSYRKEVAVQDVHLGFDRL